MTIHSSVVLSKDVELGERVVIGPNAVLLGPCTIGDDVWIGPGCVIGAPPELSSARQNVAWDDDLDHHGVEIGAGTVVREMSSIQQGSRRPTRLGAGCWLLSRSYVAHDCILEDGVTTSAGVALGGHVQIGARATLGMNATVHQRRIVGAGAMVGMSAAVTRNLPPFAKAYGTPAKIKGANTVGMSRQDINTDEIAALDTAYRAGRVPDTEFTDPRLRAAIAWSADAVART
ncbi:acyl-ACP--UDP-N-acetylglucosamine O-acyltransferase family protein [Pseudonocardia dioxanivorans]|uniref:acyl-ACP--UDP-N- acetylglucosamine O-acyltransferase n=1 Tax=Pseudonocardia dioxanivorans TaxID=240495 RepID=UPI000CD1763C|nr:acyl-ACP--UDP-N- acetylglucosamine O-acyltransferase [Pseudonocardia dioxanivorans]